MEELNQLLSDLVSINSINPDLVPGSPGEAEIAHYIADWLKLNDLEVELVESVAGRPNVVGIARGTGGGKTLLLNGHMDTVGIAGMSDAHKPFIKEGRLYGRGSYDMKGGVAACMLAIAEARKQPLRGDVVFTAVIDEEYASVGTLDLANRFHADGAIVAEFTELQLILAHRGFVWLEVETIGKAAHGSRPDLGVDAIVKMGKVLTEIEKLDQNLRANPTHPLLGSGSLHASLIQGGQELSSYPERCLLSAERRTLPGESPESVEAEFLKIIRDIQRSDSSFNAVVQRGIDRSPLETSEEADIVKTIQVASVKALNHPPQIAGVQFWTDAAVLSAAGIPSVLFGPSGSGAHAVEEWVDLSSVKACAEIYLATAMSFCE
jgi:acetylornithine deacetylase/succinyl-diaminopimelate desuccinylase family protein